MKSKAEIALCIAATSIIWVFATGMLAICIPLVDLLEVKFCLWL